METGVVVDLSDDVEIENTTRKLDRKRFNEIKKYIPFLQYITAQDPVKNEKYVKLLQWFNSNKNLPARVATTCEFAINKRFKTLKSYMVFPPHILAIFEGGEDAIDLVSDDNTFDGSLSSKEKFGNRNITESIKDRQKINLIGKKQNDCENASKSDPKPSTLTTKNTENQRTNSIICVNDIKSGQREKKINYISLSEISLNKPSTNQPEISNMSQNHDEILNQNLFDRIDNLDGNSVKPIVSFELSREVLEIEDSSLNKKSPILTTKNLENLSRKSPEHSSEDDWPLTGVLVRRKKKKRHKHKKKAHIRVIESYDGSESENHHSEIQNEKPKKHSKTKKEKLKNTRLFYVSDDEDDKSNQMCTPLKKSVKRADTDLFKRRDLSIQKQVSTESSTVVLLDSDEDEINNLSEETVQTNINILASPILESRSPPNINTTEFVNLNTEGKSSTIQLDTKNGVDSSSSSKLKDLNSMGLNELNDIYAKLCQKTGIQLEQLLGDLVNKSSIPTEEISLTQNKSICPRHTNLFDKNDSTEACEASYNMREQFQHSLQHNLHYNEQLLEQSMHYLQRRQKHQDKNQNRTYFSTNQIQINSQVPSSYQNSFMPRLNLNDPRIVQKLKQIKDSPIHNLSIRESATILMNWYTERPTFRSQSLAKVTSNTATTYGEHKRLKELEKQESDRKAKQNKEIKKNLSPILVEETSFEVGAVWPQTTSTGKEHRKDSSGSENEQNKNLSPNSPSYTGTVNRNKTKKTKENICSDIEGGIKTNKFQMNSSGSESSKKVPKPLADSKDFEKGEKTPKLCEDTEVNETVVMSFSGRPKSRQRIDSSSSTLTNDSVDIEQNTPINNTESNIRKVVQIVMSALGQKKEGSRLTPSKSRKNSTKSDEIRSKPNPVEEQVNEDKKKSSIVKSGKTKIKRLRRDTNDHLNKSPEKPKQPYTKRGCRELENLNCTFKEYSDMFEKFLLPTNDGKRLCSASNSSKKKSTFYSSDSINKKIKKTVQAYHSYASDFNPSTSKVDRAAPIARRRQTCSELQTLPVKKNRSSGLLKNSLRRFSVDGKVSKNKHDTESSDETDEFDIEEHRNIKNGLNEKYKNVDRDPFNPILRITLHRLSANEIKKWTKCEETKRESTVLSIPATKAQSTKPTPKAKNEVDFSKHEFGEKPILVAINSKPVNNLKKITHKIPAYLNNNINMTLNSTKTCVLCNKRPTDLTNHYVVQHQTESYTSRLTSEEIDNLEVNITLAVRHRNRYKVMCVFCQVELEDNFVNFHAHFSYHTGEYGFKCAVCDLVKPYREDIRSHQYRTSTCLNGKIRSNYLYSPDLVVIYLYVCSLCNFVQLNEANVHKHQRDHHGLRFEAPQNVKKCIIAALDNGEILNEIMPNDQEEDELNRIEIEKDSQNVEQEFLDEHPLDIKDISLTEQQLPTTSQLAVFENLLQDINIDNEVSESEIAPSNEADLAPLIKVASNIMTVIHTTSEKSSKETHRPHVEPVDAKPELKAIKPEPTLNSKMAQSCMVYREMPASSNYFGLYKCTLNECWFSTDEAYKFVEHITFIHNSSQLKLSLDCAYCHYKSTGAHNIVGHVRAKHSMCQFQCAECAYRSIIPGNVAVHRKLQHKNSNTVKNIYECNNRIDQLIERPINIVQKMAENISSLKCLDCSKTFYAVSSIKIHIQSVHPMTFSKLGSTAFDEFACLHCKETTNSKDSMRIHLAMNHPDEVGYVVERKLKNDSCIDAVENLNVINISLPIPPAEVHPLLIKKGDDVSNTTNTDDQNLFKNTLSPMVIKTDSPEITFVEDAVLTRPITNFWTGTMAEEEKRLKPLLELLTENTGAPAATLYRCSECVASFLHHELWRKHVVTRHNIRHKVSCPYCTKQFSLELAAIHFESHRRHEYICFHCVTSFCSREKICEHFASFHPEFTASIERKIAYGDVSFSIFKEKEVILAVIDWLPLFRKLSDELRQQLRIKLQQNQHKEWLRALSASSLTELEYLEIPKYIKNGLPRYKCLWKSCLFVGLDENSLDVHMTAHPPPDKYKCSQCLINQIKPTWESIKNHKMLHKQELYICCVCKFYHHSLSGISKHIEQFHNFRDVPVMSMWRDEFKYKISLTFFLMEKKMSFTTTDACFCCLKLMKHKLVYHLKKEHKITLCPKCVACDAILLTNFDAESHYQEHHSEPFKLKYEILTPFLYKVVVTSLSPLTFETRLIKEKRSSQDLPRTTAKKVKPNEEIPGKIKQEVLIKEECQEVVTETQPISIKCVDLENLMQNQTKSNQTSIISVQPIPALTVENPHEIQFQCESVGQCYIPNYTLLANNAEIISPQSLNLSAGINIQPLHQEMQFDSQTSPNLRTPYSQILIIEQQQTALNRSCLLLPELAPICGNCNFECSDFASLKMHFSTLHTFKNERFLFRLSRRVECVYCCFQGSLQSMSTHHQAVHLDRPRLCRSITDPNRCGVCHEHFSNPPPSNNIQMPGCACPRRQRILADCLDLSTLRLIQNFGQNYLKYKCDICNMFFNEEQICRQHIVQVHKKAIYPKLSYVEMTFVCFSCEETNASIAKMIEHIHKVHLSSLGEASIDLISSIYRKIKIIYPKGLTICAGDLKSTRQCHDVEMFKHTLENSGKI